MKPSDAEIFTLQQAIEAMERHGHTVEAAHATNALFAMRREQLGIEVSKPDVSAAA